MLKEEEEEEEGEKEDKDKEAYYPVVPAVVGTTSSSDMTSFEASG